MAGRPWTSDDLASLHAMLADRDPRTGRPRLTVHKIARRLSRTPAAVRYKVFEIGLSWKHP